MTATQRARDNFRANPDKVSSVCDDCGKDAVALLINDFGIALCRACKWPKKEAVEVTAKPKQLTLKKRNTWPTKSI
jgi:hypothetical protein